MRYSAAATVAVLATGAVAAAHGHAAHHHHHEREANAAAEAEPEPTTYTYSDGQCWGAGNGCNAKTGAPAAATQAPAQPTVQAVAPTQAAPSQAAPQVVQSMASKATSAAGSVASSVSGGNVNVVSMISAVKGMMPAVLGDSVAEDGSKKNVVNIQNKSGKNLAFVCWGPAHSWVNAAAPILALGMAPNDKKTISFDDTPPFTQGNGCSVIYESGSFLTDGQITDTWIEWTFNPDGVVDISREPDMNGATSFSALAHSGCTTDMDHCVYKCIDGTSRCGDAGTYRNMQCSGTGTNPDPLNGGCKIESGPIALTIS